MRPRTPSRWKRSALVALVTACTACSAILGLRDIDEGAAPGANPDARADTGLVATGDGGVSCEGGSSSDPRNCGSCGHVCEGDASACVTGICQIGVFAVGEEHPVGLALQGSFAYWATGRSGARKASAIDGTVSTLGKTNDGIPNFAIATTPAGDVFLARGMFDVQGLPFAKTRLIRVGVFAITPDRLAMTPDGGAALTSGASGDLRRVGAAFNGADTFLPAPVAVATLSSSPLAMVADDSDFWLSYGSGTTYAIGRIGHGQTGLVEEVVSGRPCPPTALAVCLSAVCRNGNAAFLFQAQCGDIPTSTNKLVRSTKVGGASVPLSLSFPGKVVALAVDDQRIYYVTDGPAGALRSCPISGCGDANQLIVEHTKDLRYPTALALDDATVWVAVRGDPDADAGGWIVRLPKGP